VSKTKACGFAVVLDERVTIAGGATRRTVSELVPAGLLAAVSSDAASSCSVKL
jgi:hypothetical protein